MNEEKKEPEGKTGREESRKNDGTREKKMEESFFSLSALVVNFLTN